MVMASRFQLMTPYIWFDHPLMGWDRKCPIQWCATKR